MTVRELIELLIELPEDAPVIICHELIGDKHDLYGVEYVERPNGNSQVWLHESIW